MASVSPPGMRWLPGGTFRMGADRAYPEEAPVHKVTIGGFWIDEYAVTNRDFAAFAAATGYRTIAERPLNPADYPGAAPQMLEPGSLVFHKTRGPVDLRDMRNWWSWKAGAYWRHPEGKGTSVAGRLDHPAVQVAFEDAQAYAHWAGKTLPTEAEWEFAARGGLDGAEFVWGTELTRTDAIWRTPGRESSRGKTCVQTVSKGLLRSVPFRRTGMGCSTWQGMFGNGRPIGLGHDTNRRSRVLAASPIIRAMGRSKSVTTPPDRRSGSRVRWSRGARFCALRTIAGAIARQRATPR